MIVKQRYEIGGLYKDFTNLRLVGDYKHEIKLFIYEEGHYLKSSLRFKKYDSEVPPNYLCTEIYNINHNLALKSLDTLMIDKDKTIVDKLGNYIVNKMEKLAKL